MKNKKLRALLYLTILLLIVFILLNMFSTYLSIKNSVQKSVANQNLVAARSIADSMDIEAYQRFLNNQVKSRDYRDIKAYLEDAREKIGALYVYTLMIDNPRVSKAMITGFSKDHKGDFPIGGVCTVPPEQVKQGYEGKSFITGILEDPEYGEYLTVGVPMKNQDGDIIGFLGVDVSAEVINAINGKVLKSSIAILVYNGGFVIMLLVTFFVIQKWYQKELTREVGDTEDTYQSEFQSLIASVRSLRHDFSNHIQVIHGLLKLEENAKALEYLTGLSKEVLSIESMKLDVVHPGLSVLLETKRLSAQNYNIDIEIEVSPESFNRVKTVDLIKLLSNVIDNAIEATIELPEQERRMNIACKADDEKYTFLVTNTGPMISELDLENIFASGFSTKKAQKGKVRGQGLFIVKDLVNRYDGEILVQSSEKETTVTMIIPVNG
ncbi:sensor histidine kinase [Peribacillus sp. YIM B13472]|uniref:Sensor histidine kinase CitA n=1 Tax=Peribacillus simplex TaxID=1478 RepID=A0A9W4KR68_9BACI|nr:ATP-binding protein [Peribacillus simplex]MDR4927706.1 ATP-binding protein [Peribacillus simplex]WHX92917.1 ATP-binding protein [Peribacillus simplex]CAH0187966.1 Sensor histidine kinase CitA [Peribacillus simplex]